MYLRRCRYPIIGCVPGRPGLGRRDVPIVHKWQCAAPEPRLLRCNHRAVAVLLFCLLSFSPLGGSTPSPDAAASSALEGGRPAYPTRSGLSAGHMDWLTLIERNVPPLRHARGSRWPLILWSGAGYEPLSQEQIRMLLARGITQHVRLDPRMIPTALALQRAGSPVVVMQGRGPGWPGNLWPYDLAGDRREWANQYPAEAHVPPRWRWTPSPTLLQGWAVAADRMREDLRRFRKGGVNVDAVWLDYEGEPSLASYDAAKSSPETQDLLPAEVLRSEDAFYRFKRQLWVQLLSAYVAGPVREVFPRASVTNWAVTLSSPEAPVYGWENRPHPPVGPTLFTASNPIAYAIDRFFALSWKRAYPFDRRHVDQLYMHVMLRQVSADAYNRLRMAPYVGAIAWVARWVPDLDDRRIPAMSREAYREALRHLWLRGVDAMEVFNPPRRGYEDMALYEVQDAVSVYDEMLAFAKFLDQGEVMNFACPAVQDDRPLWSGMRLGDQALIRVVGQGEVDQTLDLSPWEGYPVRLAAPRQGATYLLRLDRGARRVDVAAVR
jgi:hypothetical protein